MRRIWLAIAVSGALSATSHADSYHYEIGIEYDANRASSATAFQDPLPFIQSTTAESDDDGIELAGTWYFDGVSASAGPRSRAAFISRASAVSVSYLHADGETVSITEFVNPALPPSIFNIEQTRNDFSANLRWVWSASGWYGLAGLSRANLEIDGDSFASEISAEGFSLGFGKYVGATTAVELSVLRQQTDDSGTVIGEGSTSTEIAVGFTHIGGLGGTWQYGTDIGLSTTGRGSGEGSYDVRLSLYPSRPLAFGIEVDGALQDASEASERYGLFASWYPNERIGLDARYGWLAVEEPGNTDVDQYDFGLGVSFRF